MEGHERVRNSDAGRRYEQYLESIGINPISNLSYREILEGKTDLLVKRVSKALTRLNLNISPVPEVGLLPIGDFNAQASVAPNGEPVCFLDDGLFSHLLIFSWCIAEATIQPEGHAVKPDYSKCWLGTIALYEDIVLGKQSARDFLSSLDFTCNESWFMFGSFLSSAMQSFILAHEFAHHIMGHVRSSGKQVLMKSGAQPTIEMYNRDQLNELEADRLGAEIFLATEPDFPSPHFMCAPLVFFDYLVFEENYYRREAHVPTHPPAQMRKQILESYLLNAISTEAKNYYHVTAPFWRGVERAQIILQKKK